MPLLASQTDFDLANIVNEHDAAALHIEDVERDKALGAESVFWRRSQSETEYNLASLAPGKYISETLGLRALRALVQEKGFAMIYPTVVVPQGELASPMDPTKTYVFGIDVGGHFIVALSKHSSRSKLCWWDSLRSPENPARDKCLSHITSFIEKNFSCKKCIPSRLASPVQPEGSNDCVVFSINNILSYFGSTERVSRESLKAFL
jgi:hypothetical protein